MEPEMFMQIMLTGHMAKHSITWSIAQMKTITLLSSIYLSFTQTTNKDGCRHLSL